MQTRAKFEKPLLQYSEGNFYPGEKEDNSQVGIGARKLENGMWTTEPIRNKKSSSSANKNAAAAAAAAAAQREAEEREAQRQARIEALKEQKRVQQGYLKNNFDLQSGDAKKRSDNNLKEMYVSYMKGLKGVPQQTALWGAGGAIESLKNRGQLNYENNRVKENQSYSSVMSQLQQRYNDELMSLEEKYLSRLMSL